MIAYGDDESRPFGCPGSNELPRKKHIARDDRLENLVQAGWDAFHTGQVRWMRTVVARLKGTAPEAPEVLDLVWRQHYLEGDLERAMEEAVRAAELYPDDADLRYAAGWCLVQLGAAEDAVDQLRRAVEIDPAFADGWYELGIAWEQLGQTDEMREAFSRVYDLDAAAEPLPDRLDDQAFERVTREALDELPDPVLEAMDNVAVIIEEYPETWILDDAPYDPRLFGLFVGASFAEARGTQLAPDEPTRIYLFRRNLERQYPHPDDLRREIRTTVIHEVGHYLGLEEDDLERRGWL